MREVVLDTNFLLIPYQFKIDIFLELDHLIGEPFQAVVSTKVLSELRGLARRTGTHGAAARFALKILEARKVSVGKVDSSVPVDDWVYEYAKEKRAIACTNDRELRKRLKAERLRVVGLRSRAKLGYV
jgi:rRNA-processing protein FCF1